MAQKPAEDTTSSGAAGEFIYQTRYYNEASTHTDYTRATKTSTYGGSSTLWGAAVNEITPDMVNSNEFWVAYRVTPNTSAKVRVHAIRVTVCYELAGTKGTVSNSIGTGFMGVTRHGPVDVIVGTGGRIYTTTDAAATMSLRTTPTDNDLFDVDWDGSQFVAVGRNGTVLYSADGITWTQQLVNSPQDFYAVAAYPNKVAIGGTNEEFLFGSALTDLAVGITIKDPYLDPNA
jgi:hypothetical protein